MTVTKKTEKLSRHYKKKKREFRSKMGISYYFERDSNSQFTSKEREKLS